MSVILVLLINIRLGLPCTVQCDLVFYSMTALANSDLPKQRVAGIKFFNTTHHSGKSEFCYRAASHRLSGCTQSGINQFM